jgi:hypothetical protein
MPWEYKSVEEQRKEFAHKAKYTKNFSALCREYEITRKTGKKWIERYNNGECLSDRSHARKSISNKTPIEIEELILSVRLENPGWGGKKIREVLERQGYENLPCAKTCCNILKRNGCISKEASLSHKPFIRYEKDKCNEMWQTDFKGDFALLDGTRCYPLTILDDHSRFSIKIAPKPNTLGVKESFREAFLEYGMPLSVLSDNGAQFAGFKGGYTQFEKWLMNHNVLPIHGRIKHPQTQGKIERFHRTMKYEYLKFNEFTNLEEANKGLQDWRIKYNEIRTHEALNSLCPADIYERSDREYIEKVLPYEYDSTNHVIKVNSWGYVRFDKWQMYLSETMIGEYIEFRPNPLGDSFFACYRNFKIAEFDINTGERLNRKIMRL